jgi:hypothetical protein
MEHPARFKLIIHRFGPSPVAPIILNSWTKVVNVEKFLDATLADLAACVSSRNAGKKHWAEKLLDEKLEAIGACGIKAKIVEVQ